MYIVSIPLAWLRSSRQGGGFASCSPKYIIKKIIEKEVLINGSTYNAFQQTMEVVPSSTCWYTYSGDTASCNAKNQKINLSRNDYS
jgi:hypothetical protein